MSCVKVALPGSPSVFFFVESTHMQVTLSNFCFVMIYISIELDHGLKIELQQKRQVFLNISIIQKHLHFISSNKLHTKLKIIIIAVTRSDLCTACD